MEDLCLGKQPDLSSLEKVPSLWDAMQNTLELLQENEDAPAPSESITTEQQCHHQSVLTATSVLVSALEGVCVFVWRGG